MKYSRRNRQFSQGLLSAANQAIDRGLQIELRKTRPPQQHSCPENEVPDEIAFPEIVGTSLAMRQLLREVELVAPSDATVLISGETGTGKELIARALHQRSRRRNQALVRVNCTSIPKGLFESEFFGHAKGAFTGAVKLIFYS